MAQNIIGQVLGGQKKILDNVSSVGDVRRALGLGNQYRASVDGTPAEDGQFLRDGNYVSFSEAVKGALRVVAGFRVGC